jgi:RNA polymerase sigma factor (sigma-70 family)
VSERSVAIHFSESSQQMDREGILMLRSQLVRYCEFLSGSTHDAQDLVQATLLKALPALLKRIAKNTWLDHLRKQGKNQFCDPIELVGDSFVDPLDSSSLEEALQVLVGTLTPQQRTVVLLCDVFQYTDREAADILGVSRGAVKATLHRARVRMEPFKEGVEVSSVIDIVQKEILEAYVSAFKSADIRTLIHLCQDGFLDPIHATTKVLTFAERQVDTRKATDCNSISRLAAA